MSASSTSHCIESLIIMTPQQIKNVVNKSGGLAMTLVWCFSD